MGFGGKPLACRNASDDELKAYSNVLKQKNKGAIEIALTRPLDLIEPGAKIRFEGMRELLGTPVGLHLVALVSRYEQQSPAWLDSPGGLQR